MKRLVILILLMGALIIPLTAYAQPQTAPSVVATGSDNVPKPMAYVAFKGSDGQVQKQIFELDQDNVVTVNQNGRLSFYAVEGISISMVKITDVNKVTYGVPVQDNSVVLSIPRGVYSLNAISGPYAYTGIVGVTGPQSHAAGQSQGQGGGQDNDPEIITIIDRVIIDTITFVDVWIITLFQPIAIIPVGLPADIALNGIGEPCYGYDVAPGQTCNRFPLPSVFDPALRDVEELKQEDTDEDENEDENEQLNTLDTGGIEFGQTGNTPGPITHGPISDDFVPGSTGLEPGMQGHGGLDDTFVPGSTGSDPPPPPSHRSGNDNIEDEEEEEEDEEEEDEEED